MVLVLHKFSHGTAALLKHCLLVNLHNHNSAQGRSQGEFPTLSLCSLQLVLTSQESRHASLHRSLAVNLLLLRCGHFLALHKLQGEMGILQILTTLHRSLSCYQQILTVRLLKKGG